MKNFKSLYVSNLKKLFLTHFTVHTVVQVILGLLLGTFSSALAVGTYFTVGLALLITVLMLTSFTIYIRTIQLGDEV